VHCRISPRLEPIMAHWSPTSGKLSSVAQCDLLHLPKLA
jgi:hypothetical protein